MTRVFTTFIRHASRAISRRLVLAVLLVAGAVLGVGTALPARVGATSLRALGAVALVPEEGCVVVVVIIIIRDQTGNIISSLFLSISIFLCLLPTRLTSPCVSFPCLLGIPPASLRSAACPGSRQAPWPDSILRDSLYRGTDGAPPGSASVGGQTLDPRRRPEAAGGRRRRWWRRTRRRNRRRRRGWGSACYRDVSITVLRRCR